MPHSKSVSLSSPDIYIKCLGELLHADSRHSRRSDHLPSVIACILSIYKDGSCDAFLTAVDELVQYYADATSWIQSKITEQLRRSRHFVLMAVFCSRCGSKGVSFPRQLLFQATFAYSFPVRMSVSYAMGYGRNSFYNLGIPSEGDVKSQRIIPVPEILKVSMSASHTLFLTRDHQVFCCGSGVHGKMSPLSNTLVVTPTILKIPTTRTRIINVLACSDHSVFISRRSVYVCGRNSKHNISQGENSDLPMTRHRLTEEGEDELKGVIGGPSFTLVFSSKAIWLTGVLGGLHYNGYTRFAFQSGPEQLDIFSLLENVRLREIGLNPPSRRIFIDDEKNTSSLPGAITDLDWFPLEVEIPGNDSGKNEDVKHASFRCSLSPSGSILASLGNAKIKHECFTSVNGVLTKLKICQFHCTTSGRVTLLGSPLSSQCGQSLYRGHIAVVDEVSASEGFEVQEREKGASPHDLRLILVIDEVPGAYSVREFSITPDGQSVIYVVDKHQAGQDSESTCSTFSKWNSTDVDALNSSREQCGLEQYHKSTTFSCSASNDMTNLVDMVSATIPEAVKLWLPRLATRICLEGSEDLPEHFNLSKELAFFKVERCSEVRLVSDYLNGIRRIDWYPEEYLENASTSDALQKLGLQVYENSNSLWIRTESNTADYCETGQLELDCVLVSNDNVEIDYNVRWLCLQSPYFEMAVSYSSDSSKPVFRVDSPSNVVATALQVLSQPSMLLELPFAEIVPLIVFFDEYSMCAAIEDCLLAMFERSNEFNVCDLFDLYLFMEHLRPSIVNHFAKRLHLVTHWLTSALCPLQLLAELEEASSIGDNVPSSLFISSNHMFVGGCFIPEHDAEYDDKLALAYPCNWGRFNWSSVRRILLGPSRCAEWLTSEVQREHKDAHAVLEEDNDVYQWSVYNSFDQRPALLEQLYATASITPSGTSLAPKKPLTVVPAEHDNGDPVNGVDRLVLAKTESEIPIVVKKEEELKENLGAGDAGPSSGLTINDHSQEHRLVSPIQAESSPFLQQPCGKHSRRPKFAPKGTKFRPFSLVKDSFEETHVAPWAGLSSSLPSSSSVTLSVIQAEEAAHQRSSPNKPVPQNKRTKNLWSKSVSEEPENIPVSLASIIAEETKRTSKVKNVESRPLHLVAEEENAIEQIARLYEESAGDEVIVRVQVDRIRDADDSPIWQNVYRTQH